jgi:hypothetical protein
MASTPKGSKAKAKVATVMHEFSYANGRICYAPVTLPKEHSVAVLPGFSRYRRAQDLY